MRSQLLGTLLLLPLLCVGCFSGDQQTYPTPETPSTASRDSIPVTKDPQNPTKGWILMGSGDEFVPIPVRLEHGVWVIDQTRPQPQDFQELLEKYGELRQQDWRR